MRWLIWILFLAFLSVGAQNSHKGLSGDGPLYASISEQMLQSGEYFKMDTKVPDFGEAYSEHPHLSFWLQAGIFSIFGAEDWSARILGHIYYVAYLLLFFVCLEYLCSTAAAVFGVLLLWSLSQFSNVFSNFLLDPGALFWGTAFLASFYIALEQKSRKQAIFSGVSLGLCALSKGVAFLAFGPPAVFIAVALFFASNKRESPPAKNKLLQFFLLGSLSVVCFFIVVGSYYYATLQSHAPNFIENYWARQMSGRFLGTWSLRSLFLKEFWWPFLKDSNFLLLLLPLAFFSKRPKLFLLGVPLAYLTSFVLSFAPNHRFGGQYVAMLLPAVAWMLAVAIERITKHFETLSILTGYLALIAAAGLQYSGLEVHRSGPGIDLQFLQQKNVTKNLGIYFDSFPRSTNFISSSRVAWYSKARVHYVVSDIPQPSKEIPLYLYNPGDEPFQQDRIEKLHARGWCTSFKDKRSMILEDCSGAS